MLPEHACLVVTDYMRIAGNACPMVGLVADAHEHWRLFDYYSTCRNRRTFRGTQVQRPGATEKRQPLSLAAFWKVPASVS